MDVLALPPLGRVMQTACTSLGRHPLLMDGDSPANVRRGSPQAGNEIRAAAHHLLLFGCSASSGLCPPSLPLCVLLTSSFTSYSSWCSSISCFFPSLRLFSSSFFPNNLPYQSMHTNLLSTCFDSPPFPAASCLQFSSILLRRPEQECGTTTLQRPDAALRLFRKTIIHWEGEVILDRPAGMCCRIYLPGL